MKRLRYEIEFENGAKVSDRVGSGDLSARAGLIPEQGAADTRKNTTEQKGHYENVKKAERNRSPTSDFFIMIMLGLFRR